MADQWITSLTVLALLDGIRVTPTVLEYPRAYLELHEIPADFLVEQGSDEVFVRTAGELQADLVLLGGYNVSALEEVVLGSAANILLRQAVCPLFICR